MLKLIRFILWVLVVLALTVGFDRVMHLFEFTTPGLKQAQDFYIDFRHRLVGLTQGTGPQNSIEGVIDGNRDPEAEPIGSSRYLYVDDFGALQFVDRLKDVPARFRGTAQPLAD
jgi:hypothetical protein